MHIRSDHLVEKHDKRQGKKDFFLALQQPSYTSRATLVCHSIHINGSVFLRAT